jgi:tRNAThr (cytosine32-N3)-methyltransferase
VYFFEQEELEEIWGGRKRDTSIGNIADTTISGTEEKEVEEKMESLDLHDPEQQEGHQSNDDVNNPETPRPTFEVAHIGVDRRMLVNRQRRLKMYRCWMQAVFRKAGQESQVATSTLRQEKEGEEVQEDGGEEVQEGGEAEGGGVKV